MNETPPTTEFRAIVLAAGKGTRMGSPSVGKPKVLAPLVGPPILSYVLDALREAGIERGVIVVGDSGEAAIRESLGDDYIYAVQREQLGSGHAVMSARDAAIGSNHLLVMCGDSPLFTPEAIRSMMQTHLREHATLTLAAAILDDPHGYGRIVRAPSGEIVDVVEEKSATEEQRRIREVNGGCYAFDARWLWDNLDLMRRNEAGEYCLTEMVGMAIRQGRRVASVAVSEEEIAGVNTPEQLREAERIIRDRERR